MELAELSENQVIDYLHAWLESKDQGWTVIKENKGFTRGPDIEAQKGRKTLIVEAKGSKANPKAHNKKHDRFDSSQIKDHFGIALVKVLEQRNLHPKWIVKHSSPYSDSLRFLQQETNLGIA